MDQADVADLITHTFGASPTTVQRMAFGHTSVTYKVDVSNRQLIVRTNAAPSAFAHTVGNLETLRSLGLPAPRLLASNLSSSRYGAAYLILESIPGRDLRFELRTMNRNQQFQLANELVGFQRKVGSLPHPQGYGYAAIQQNGPLSSWVKVVESQIADVSHTSLPRLARLTRAVHRGIRAHASELSAVPPTCFLDDLTTKNVIVQEGVLQGIVDLDFVCYGDPLFWIALTAVAIVSDLGAEFLTYAAALCDSWGLVPRSSRLLALYVVVHCQRFIAQGASSEPPAWTERMFSYAEGQASMASA
jgi:aminoglycoside phosphotransferase (APT) family kinase protein